MDEFGEAVVDKRDRPIGLALPLKPLNMIEHELGARYMEELVIHDAPVPFIEDDGALENAEDYVKRYDRELNLDDVMTLRDLVEEELLERYRLPLIIARELGPTQHDGRPTIEEYRIACALENVDPII